MGPQRNRKNELIKANKAKKKKEKKKMVKQSKPSKKKKVKKWKDKKVKPAMELFGATKTMSNGDTNGQKKQSVAALLKENLKRMESDSRKGNGMDHQHEEESKTEQNGKNY